MHTRSKLGVYIVSSHPIAVRFGPRELDTTKQACHDKKITTMKAELHASAQNHTWLLVRAPSTQKVIDNKWVFKVKYLPTNAVQRFDARLVAEGFAQTPRVDFSETYIPVVKPCTVRLVINPTMFKGWDVKLLDINNAFLHGILIDDV